MAAFHFDLVSPERMVFSGEVEQVDVPGAEGDFGVLAGHAPMVAMLKPGILSIFQSGTPERIVVGGGFAEVNPESLTVLAELAVPVDQFDRAQLADQIKDTEEDFNDATDPAVRDKAQQRLEQLRALDAILAR